MSFRLSLAIALFFSAAAPAVAEPGSDPSAVPAVEEMTGFDTSSAPTGNWNSPLIVRSVDEAKKHFADADIGKLEQRLDFKERYLLLFRWRGAPQDRLSFEVAASDPSRLIFLYAPGNGDDLRTHSHLFSLRADLKWDISFATVAEAESGGGGFLQRFLEPVLGGWLYVDSYLWTIVGFMGAAVFGSRFLLQWLQSEKERRLVVPWYFWHLSFWGSSLNMLYFLHLDKAPLILGNCFLPILYARNLILLHRGGRSTLRSGEPDSEAGKNEDKSTTKTG